MLRNKKTIAMRLHPDMLDNIDFALRVCELRTRTALIENAVELYIQYLLEKKRKS